MKVENARIFISDLPEIAAPNELENAVKHYGNVTSVEIKERKELGPKNNSLFFAYINVQIDSRSLQQCFQDFANGKYFGQYILLQIARESFLDRLKREREESDISQVPVNVSNVSAPQPKIYNKVTNGLRTEKLKKYDSTDSESEQSKSSNTEIKKECVAKVSKHLEKNDTIKVVKNDVHMNETLDLIVKNNKGKTVDKNGLTIESVGKSPILKIDKSKKKMVVNSSEANLKRLQSLNNMKKKHKSQISLIQQALSKIDNNSNKKIIFDETENDMRNSSYKSKKSLFEEELQEDDFEPNFEVKEQFQGEKGQKLLELQTRFKNDKRFNLDARFFEDDEEKSQNDGENTEELSFEEEKQKEYEILEQVLGTKVLSKQKKATSECSDQKKTMLRFDPTQPEHLKFEVKNEIKKKKKRKRENSESDVLQEKKREEPEVPQVSKELFYKVTDELKDSLKEKHEFSLLSTFGKVEDKEQYPEDVKEITNTTTNFVKERNPFRYDSSDDEDETNEIHNKEDIHQTEKVSVVNEPKISKRNMWYEPFFFTDDDYRLQEGIDFVEKISSQDDNDFTKLRRNLKEIVKAKVRNNQRKNRPFKKKLGGSKKKKMLRIKKALKR